MARPCTICSHREREKIDELLISGTSYRDISNRFGLSRTAVWRHRNEHIPRVLAKAEEFQEIQLANRLHDQITGLIGKSLAILQKAEGIGDLRIALAAIRETRGNLELLGKVTGELSPSKEEEREHRPMMNFPPGCNPIINVNLKPGEPVKLGDRRLDEQSSAPEPIKVDAVRVEEEE